MCLIHRNETMDLDVTKEVIQKIKTGILTFLYAFFISSGFAFVETCST